MYAYLRSQRLESNQVQQNMSIHLQKHLEGNQQEVVRRHIYPNNIHHYSSNNPFLIVCIHCMKVRGMVLQNQRVQ